MIYQIWAEWETGFGSFLADATLPILELIERVNIEVMNRQRDAKSRSGNVGRSQMKETLVGERLRRN